MFRSCNKLFSDTVEISDCIPLSSDGEQGPGYISISGINNDAALIIT